MSAKQVSLKSRGTIAVVLLLLVAVVYLNVNTFGGGQNKNSRGYRVQAHPPVPMDAVKEASFEAGTVSFSNHRPSAFLIEKLHRDPFSPGKKTAKIKHQRVSSSSKSLKKSQPKAKNLICTAIMLGGTQPMAIINGEGRYPGEKIQGMVLKAIDADGVTLQKAGGATVHLPVGVQEDKNPSFRVVTRNEKTEDQDPTRLVNQ